MLYRKDIKTEERTNLPLNGPSNYRVSNGIIYTRALEINAVRQCNLSCRGCSHSSPLAENLNYDPIILQNDLSTLSNYIKCESIRIVGGEPLLHPNFTEILKAIKNSNISEKICLVTNGLILDKMDKSNLKYIDKIEISLYPLSNILVDKIRKIAEQIIQLGTKVTILEYNTFRESISRNKTLNINTIKMLYNTCQIAHFWRCITIDKGKLYRCPQSMILSEKTGDFSETINIYELKNIEMLLNFLENNEPIKACSYCLGSIGKSFKHQQLHKSKWESALPDNPDDAIDCKYANKLLKDAHFTNGCMFRNKLNK